jgi:nitrate/nitrite transporter NarK
LAVISKTALLRLFPILRRFVPIVGRGLALGFAVLAVATAFFAMGDYWTARDRFLVAGLYAVFAGASMTVAVAIAPILRWVLRRL